MSLQLAIYAASMTGKHSMQLISVLVMFAVHCNLI